MAVLAAACARTSPFAERPPGDDQTDGDPLVVDELVLFGQVSPDVNTNLEHGLELPSGMAVCGGRLFVVDQFHQRVLAWDDFPARGPPSLVLGQRDFTTRIINYGGIDARGFDFPDGIACTADTLAVADTANSRVLIWKPLPTTNFEAAVLVVGQPDFTTSGPGVTAATLNGPAGVAIVNNALFVADTGNNRILAWTPMPTVSGANASFVMGQTSFTNSGANGNGAVSANGYAAPGAIASDGNRFFVADTGNNRVLVWNTIPAAAVPPSFVLGQSTFATGSAPALVTQSSLASPHGFGLLSGSPNLAVCDLGEDRVLLFTAPITANNQPANAVVGTSVHTGGLLPAYSATTLTAPRALIQNGTEVYIADSQAHRITVYDASEVLTHAPPTAKAVIGQPSLSSGAKRCPEGGVTGATLGMPMDVALNGNQILVVDFIYHRVLGWNTLPVTGGTSADFVLGQPDLFSYDPHEDNANAASFFFPTAALVAGGDLHVVDRDHNRILVWNGVPTSNAPPVRALGQPTLTAIDVHPPDNVSFRQPTNLATDGTRLAVADTANNRVMLWNTIPANGSVPADRVLGQSTFDIVTPNTGGLSASSLRSPRDITFTPSGLAVADTGNHRVLIWNTLPTTNAQAADVVLGQTAMNLAEEPRTNASSTVDAVAVHYADGLFYVSTMQRILVWHGVPTSNNAPADFVIGQASFTSNLGNDGGIGIGTLQTPMNIATSGATMFISDVENDRIIERPHPEL